MKRSTIVLLAGLGAALLFLLLFAVFMGLQLRQVVRGRAGPVAAAEWRREERTQKVAGPITALEVRNVSGPSGMIGASRQERFPSEPGAFRRGNPGEGRRQRIVFQHSLPRAHGDHHRGETRYKTTEAVAQGSSQAFVEFTNPEDRGVRYLKRDKNLWIYFPKEQDTVNISGHLLKEGMPGPRLPWRLQSLPALLPSRPGPLPPQPSAGRTSSWFPRPRWEMLHWRRGSARSTPSST